MFNFSLRELSFYDTPKATVHRVMLRIIVNANLFAFASLIIAFVFAMLFSLVSVWFLVGFVFFVFVAIGLYAVENKDPTRLNIVHSSGQTLHLALLFPKLTISASDLRWLRNRAVELFEFETKLHDQTHLLADLLGVDVKNLVLYMNAAHRVQGGHSVDCAGYLAEQLAQWRGQDVLQLLYVDFNITDPTQLAICLDAYNKFYASYDAYNTRIALWLPVFGVVDGLGINAAVRDLVDFHKPKSTIRGIDAVKNFDYSFDSVL